MLEHQGSGAIEPILEMTKTGRGKAFLDVACGPGWLAAAADQRGARATGVDISETMLMEARRRFPHIRFEHGDTEALPLEAEVFDGVGCNFGMLHIGRPETALQEMRRGRPLGHCDRAVAPIERRRSRHEAMNETS